MREEEEEKQFVQEKQLIPNMGPETVSRPRVGCRGLTTQGSVRLRGLRGLWNVTAGSKSELCHLLICSLWASNLNSHCLSFHICTVGMMIIAFTS